MISSSFRFADGEPNFLPIGTRLETDGYSPRGSIPGIEEHIDENLQELMAGNDTRGREEDRLSTRCRSARTPWCIRISHASASTITGSSNSGCMEAGEAYRSLPILAASEKFHTNAL